MKQTFTLLAFFLLGLQQTFAQKIALIQNFKYPPQHGSYLLAEDHFYVNQGATFDVLNLRTLAKSTVTKSEQRHLQPGINFGPVGSAVVFNGADPFSLYLADHEKSEALSGPERCEKIVAGKTFTLLNYTSHDNLTTKIVAINNKTQSVVKVHSSPFRFTSAMVYFEKTDRMYFAVPTREKHVQEVYLTDGTEAGTTRIGTVQGDAAASYSTSFFINNGDELYFAHSIYSSAGYSNRVFRVSTEANSLTSLGNFDDFGTREGTMHFRNNVLYGLNNKTYEIVKSDGEKQTSLLKNILQSPYFKGEMNSKVLFTLANEISEAGDSLSTLYETDGTAAGTRIISGRTEPYSANTFLIHQGMLYFVAHDVAHGAEIFRYDGKQVDLVPGKSGLKNVHFYTLDEDIYLSATTETAPGILNLYKITDNASAIYLSTYADYNNNQVKDADEPYLPRQRFTLNEGNLHTSQTAAKVTLEHGTYTLTLQPAAGWKPSGSATVNVSLPDDGNKRYTFAVTPADVITKVEASLVAGRTRCSFPETFRLHYRNSGTTTAGGTIRLKPDKQFEYLSAVPAPSTKAGDTLIWNLPALQPQQEGVIHFEFKMPDLNSMGDTLVSQVFTSFKNTDFKTTHADTATARQVLTCSYDPNDIQVKPMGLGQKHLTLKKQELEYLIRFQNMGNDKAYNIVVTNQLQQELDMSTLKVLGSSHPMYTLAKGNNLSFVFKNIQLPHDKEDEPGSHGYILYSIKPKAGLRDSTVINNQAFIYFDYNPAIETNITTNTLVDKMPVKMVLGSADEWAAGNLSIYPNPADDVLLINWSGNHLGRTRYLLLNSKGQSVLQAEYSSDGVHQLNVATLPPGLYFLQAIWQNKVVVKKIIIR